MDTTEVINLLGGVSVGTVIAWGSVLLAICSGISIATVHLYKLFCSYKSYKDENEKLRSHVDDLTENQKQILNKLDTICLSLVEQKEVNLKQLRYSLVHICDEAITCGCISVGKLRSLEEMYDEYVTIFHGNGYVKTLVERVRKLEITGRLDD